MWDFFKDIIGRFFASITLMFIYNAYLKPKEKQIKKIIHEIIVVFKEIFQQHIQTIKSTFSQMLDFMIFIAYDPFCKKVAKLCNYTFLGGSFFYAGMIFCLKRIEGDMPFYKLFLGLSFFIIASFNYFYQTKKLIQ